MWPRPRDRDQVLLKWPRLPDRGRGRLSGSAGGTATRSGSRSSAGGTEDPPRPLRLKQHLLPHLEKLPLALPSLKKAVTVRKNISRPAGVFCKS